MGQLTIPVCRDRAAPLEREGSPWRGRTRKQEMGAIFRCGSPGLVPNISLLLFYTNHAPDGPPLRGPRNLFTGQKVEAHTQRAFGPLLQFSEGLATTLGDLLEAWSFLLGRDEDRTRMHMHMPFQGPRNSRVDTCCSTLGLACLSVVFGQERVPQAN